MVVPVGRAIAASQESNAMKNYTFPADIGPHGLLMVFRKYQYQSNRGVNRTRPISSVAGSVLLPLPRQLIDSTSVRLGTKDLGIMGDAIASAMAAGKNDMGAIADGIMSVVNPTALAKGLANAGKAVLGFDPNGELRGEMMEQMNFLIRRATTGMGISGALDAGSGAALNPKTSLLFEGVNFREYDFDFELMPRSPQESDNIKNIADFIHHHSLPQFRELSIGNQGFIQNVFLDYPSTVDLFLLGVDQGHYMWYKTCMISRFVANKSPTGGSQHAIMKGGKPAIVTFNISLTEMDIRTRDDYPVNGSGGRID